MPEHTTLGAAGRARFVLGTAAGNLEGAIASPVQDVDQWRKQVDQDLEILRTSLTQHVALTEGDDGLLAQIITDAPRLASSVDVILADHAELCEGVDLTQDILDQTPDRILDIRVAVIDLLALLTAHRHRGADLVYDAYNVDIGGLSGE